MAGVIGAGRMGKSTNGQNILGEHIPNDSIDLVYLDPPFKSHAAYNLPFREKENTHRAVEAFKDTWAWQVSLPALSYIIPY